MTSEATTTSGDVTGPIVAILPPPPALRASVARLIVEILARRALADLGVIAHNDNQNHHGSHA